MTNGNAETGQSMVIEFPFSWLNSLRRRPAASMRRCRVVTRRTAPRHL